LAAGAEARARALQLLAADARLTGTCVMTAALPCHGSQPMQLEWPTLSLNSSGIFSLSTFALSLLLVFRTNSSYEVSMCMGAPKPCACGAGDGAVAGAAAACQTRF
jgi:hypothetical protein